MDTTVDHGCAQCDNGGAGSLEDRPALWAERARLIRRITEIDALLDQPMPPGLSKI